MNYPNGRVNILDNAANSVFNLYDKIPVEQNITSYRNDRKVRQFGLGAKIKKKTSKKGKKSKK